MKVGYQILADLQQQQAFKQWGTNTIGSRTTRTEAYPLPYSEFCLPIVSGKGYVGGLNYGFGVGVTNFGLTSVTIANNSEDSSYRWTGYTYIVVGAQPQWGYQKQLTVEPVVYPLPVNTVCCVWAHSIHDRQDPGTYHSILSKITPVGVQILAGQYNAPATAYSGISAYWGMIGW